MIRIPCTCLDSHPDLQEIIPETHEATLFHVIGIDVVLGIEEKQTGDLTVSDLLYQYIGFERHTTHVHLGVVVAETDKVRFRIRGGGNLPPGKYIVSSYGSRLMAMKTLE